jgi:hypothetical protein
MTFGAIVLAGPGAMANFVTGSIGFGADGVTINSANLATATSFTVTSPFTDEETGTYAAVPQNTGVTFNGFVFNPPTASITPLWTFDIGSTVYSFDATSDMSFFNSTLDQWDIGGNGIAMVTGYTPTDGTWNVNLSQSGASFVFDSSEAALSVGVADSGSSLALLGGAFIVLGALGRKFRC